MPLITSEASASFTITPYIQDWWIKDPLGQFSDLLIHVEGEDLRRDRIQQSATYRPLGRKHPVVVSDKIEGFNGKLDIGFVDDEEGYDKLMAIFDSQRVMLLQNGWLSEQYYVRFRDNWTERIHNTTPPYRVVTVEYIEQESPA